MLPLLKLMRLLRLLVVKGGEVVEEGEAGFSPSAGVVPAFANLLTDRNRWPMS